MNAADAAGAAGVDSPGATVADADAAHASVAAATDVPASAMSDAAPAAAGGVVDVEMLPAVTVVPKVGELILETPRRGKPPQHLADLTPPQRREALTKAGLPAYRADQIARHFFVHHTADPADWTDIPAGDRERLAQALTPNLLTEVKTLVCDNGTTRKTLWRLHDGSLVESVLMRYPDRVTMCISSQAGCGMNCPFCATGQGGLTRNLSTAEIVEQVIAGARSLARGDVAGGPGRVSNVVLKIGRAHV